MTNMHFSLEQLQAFVAVYEQLSFSKAALTLNKHRTTIGQVVTNLEDQLAVELFERTGRTVIPTEDGDLLYHYAKQTLEQARAFDKIALSLSSGSLENITIAYPSIIPLSLLYKIRNQLASSFPLLRVNFLERDKEAIKVGIANGDYHFGLVNIHESTAIHSFDATVLGHLEFVPFAQKGCALTKIPSKDMRSHLQNTRQFLLKSLTEDGVKNKMLISATHEVIDEMQLVIKFVKEGLGWAFLPKLLTKSEYGTNHIQQLEVDEMLQGFKFAISIWSPYSKQLLPIKKSILIAIEASIIDIKSLNIQK